MLLRTTHFLPREPTERQFLFKSSRALARGLLLNRHSASVQEPDLNELKQTVFKFSLQKAAESSGVARLKKLNTASDPMRVNWHD
jgi:hypothetical protein